MKKIIQRLSKQVKPKWMTLSLGLLMLPVSSQAATLDDVVNSINNVWALVASSVSAAATTYANMVYEDNPSLPATVAGNTTQPTANTVSDNRLKTLSMAQIKQSLTDETDVKTQLGVIPASDTFVKPSMTARITGPGKALDLTLGDANLDFQSLISPIAYDNAGLTRASNFIKYAANLGDPITTIKWSDLNDEQKQKLDSTATGRDYKVYVRSQVAARSVAIDNLLDMLAERTPSKDLGTQAGLSQADASALQVKEHIATRRTRDAEWYNNMAKASPATIARETLFVLAEIQNQLYDLHKDNERLLATSSMLQLQGTQLSKFMNHQREQEIKTLLGISTAGELPPTTGIPGVTTP